MQDTKNQLSFISVSLHWLIAIGIIIMLAVGIYMKETEALALYPIHKSIGVILLAFILFRIYWRIKNGWLPALSNNDPKEIRIARIVQTLLLIGTVMMPLSGIIMSGGGGYGIEVFGIELIAKNPDPNDAEKVIAINPSAANIGHIIHGFGGNILIFAILLHILGAVKQKILYKDSALARIAGKKV